MVLIAGLCLGVLWMGYALGKRGGLEQGQAWELKSLAEENAHLRIFNAREVRRLKLRKGYKIEAPLDCLALAHHVEGVAPSVIAAVWKQESGPPDIETGVLGKSDFISKNFEMRYWPALEAARTLNHWAWAWFTTTAEGRLALARMLTYTAPHYVALGIKDHAAWVRNVLAYERQARETLGNPSKEGL